jgi:hypothetical protein
MREGCSSMAVPCERQQQRTPSGPLLAPHHLRSGMAVARSTGTAVTLFWGEPSTSFSE